jgi:sec-independent protein translocase protein TatB
MERELYFTGRGCATGATGEGVRIGATRAFRASFPRVFGFSFGELVVLIIVAVIVIGPKDLPKVLRKMGQTAGKLRRMAAELRAQSGIDDVLRAEGLSEDINEIRKLARGELDQVTRAARVDLGVPAAARPPGAVVDPLPNDEIPIDRDRELPREGADAYRALPDTAIVYAETLPASPLARDPLYVTGDAAGVIPEPEPIQAAAIAPTEIAMPAPVPSQVDER